MIVRFFRAPNRVLNGGEDIISCPADGKVVVIERTIEPEYSKMSGSRFRSLCRHGMFISNWFPVSGMIKYYFYHPGKHMVAFSPKASLENERATT